jgi:hypothetical protein
MISRLKELEVQHSCYYHGVQFIIEQSVAIVIDIL